MSYSASTASPTTAMRAALAADKPLFLASSAHLYNALPRWSTTGSWSSGSDVSATGYPASLAVDGLIDLPTRPAVSAVSTYYLLLDLADITIDTIALIGHNLGSWEGALSVWCEIASLATFADAISCTSVLTPTDDSRLLWTELYYVLSHPVTYSAARYVRVVFHLSSGTFAYAPEFGELVLGARRQLGRRPDRPWDSRAMVSDITSHRTKAGGSARYVRSAGGVVLRPTWTPTLAVESISGLDDGTTLRGIWSDSGYGARCVLFLDSPTSSPKLAHWCELEASFTRPEVDYQQGTCSLVLTEQPPYALVEAGL